MYLPAAHAETRIPVLRALIHEYPLGILTTAIPSDTHPLIQSSHIPWVLDVADETSDSELGVLRGHAARMNPQMKTMVESIKSAADGAAPATPAGPGKLEREVMVLFQSPAQSYVTPKFYTHTKPDSGKVVPTWNYAAVQAYGRATVYYDHHAPETGAFLARQIDDVSAHGEERVMGFDGAEGRQGAWRVADAPENYIRQLSKAIVGIEIRIDRLEGKFKMSQEMGVEDRRGVAKGFAGLGTPVGDSIARLVEERSRMKETKARP